ncbi:hypothetical protein [Gordonia malaquae]|uniref:hypothetical protein n=1 Tax=Gordonia malaquae TaxID=410332 RepID=UPI0030FE56E9
MGDDQRLMEITFTKLAGRYDIAVHRDVGHALAPRNGPGFHDAVPHDVAHLIVETEWGIRGGVYGRLAAADGDDGMFWAADLAVKRKATKNRRTPTESESADMAKSERLASLTVALWEVARGRRRPDPAWPGTEAASGESPELLQKVYDRYDDFSRTWSSLPAGRSVTMPWPFPEGVGTRARL